MEGECNPVAPCLSVLVTEFGDCVLREGISPAPLPGRLMPSIFWALTIGWPLMEASQAPATAAELGVITLTQQKRRLRLTCSLTHSTVTEVPMEGAPLWG